MDLGSTVASAEVSRLERLVQRRFASHRWGRMCWRRVGGGRPLVLIHGGHGGWLHWVHNIEALAERHAVWIVDLPGYGDSDALPAGSGLPQITEALVHTLRQMIGTDTAVDVLGFSFGGLVAAHVAAEMPQVRRLALLGPVGHRGSRRPRASLMSWRHAADAADDLLLAHVMRHNLSAHMLSVDAQAVDPLAVHIHTQCCLHTRFRSKEISQGGGLVEALHRYGRPVLLAWGEHDVTAEPDVMAQQLAGQVAGSTTHIFRNAGHWVQYEGVDAVNRTLIGWFAASMETKNAKQSNF